VLYCLVNGATLGPPNKTQKTTDRLANFALFFFPIVAHFQPHTLFVFLKRAARAGFTANVYARNKIREFV